MPQTAPPSVEHSPYWVHQRKWMPLAIQAAAGQSTAWIEVGGLLDSLNDGQWKLTATPVDKLHYTVEIGLRSVDGRIESIRHFERRSTTLDLAYDADTRYSRRIRETDDVLYHLLNDLKQQPANGLLPRRTPQVLPR